MKRLLVVNVYFAPRSFGGATIVAENLARKLMQENDWEVFIVTSFNDDRLLPYSLVRYSEQGFEVIAVNIPDGDLDYEESYRNLKFVDTFASIVDALLPDVAHIHCIQNMGSGVINILTEKQIPTAVTVHDCWWICEKQFMINSNQKYCYQELIDFSICRYCVPDVKRARKRYDHLISTLLQTDLILFPSEFQRNLYIKNGLPSYKCRVNKNGVIFPKKGYRKKRIRSRNIKLRFGFVGGPGPIKGGDLIQRAFRGIDDTSYELRIVDSATNIGSSWRHGLEWDIPGKLTIIPAYTQETMDEFFSNIDVLLFPSQWKESFGLTVREALVRDVWVIATNGGGTVEDCVDGINSTIIPLNNNHLPLKEAIKACLKRSDWEKYQNPRKKDIWDVDRQATELSGYLKGLSSGKDS